MSKTLKKIPVLDHGYVMFIEAWGSDERIVETARMSTQRGFVSWDSYRRCRRCDAIEVGDDAPLPICAPRLLPGEVVDLDAAHDWQEFPRGDAGLLAYLHQAHHDTPFEFAGLTVEVQLPIMCFREWHRHRTQSYSEMSARYAPLPALDYVPTPERCLVVNGANKQANAVRGADELTHESALEWLEKLAAYYGLGEELYQDGLRRGLPKELARLPLTMGRYSRMRATANLRNWLGFGTLRSDHHLNGAAAQLELRLAANVVMDFVAELFPRVYDLYVEPKRRGPLVSFDAAEQAAMRNVVRGLAHNRLGIGDVEDATSLAEEIAAPALPKPRLAAFMAKVKKLYGRA